MPLDVLFRQRRHARGNFAVDRNINDPALRRSRDQGARFAGVPLQETFSLERGKVLHDRSLTRKPEMFLDLARARGQTFGPLFCLDKLQDVLLPGSEHVNILPETSRRCNSKSAFFS